MPTPLSESTIALIKATVPALEAHGLAITNRMYDLMFRTDAIRDLFNQSHHGATGAQPKALAAAVLAYARNIDNLGALGGAVERIAQKHVALNILPEHYPFVADALLGAIKDVLGTAANDKILAAWGEAYWFLAEILIGREATVYRELASRPGGWNGWREFLVQSVRDESSIIRSFTLTPADGGKVVRHKPGQYLGFALDLPRIGRLRRHYSISSGPADDAYRITVKREAAPGSSPGRASNWLHDHALPGTLLHVSPPAGDFFLDPMDPGPVVLVSGGVGLTPMLSMVEAIVRAGSAKPIWWIHGAMDGRVHAMRDHVRALRAKAQAMTVATFYAQPLERDVQGRDFEHRGLITGAWLAANTPLSDATYYLCGPRPFLRSLVSGLGQAGVEASRIRYEFFGPAEELLETQVDPIAA